MPVSVPCASTLGGLAISQCGFISFIVCPLLEAWVAAVGCRVPPLDAALVRLRCVHGTCLHRGA